MTSVVEFSLAYRLLGHPALTTNSSFSYKASAFSADISEAVQKLRDSKVGRFDELLVDGKEVKPQAVDFSQAWSAIEFIFLLDTSGRVPIFRNFEQLMTRSKSFVRESLPSHFYLLDDDILSSEEPIDQRIETLRGICQLIVYLADLANFHNEEELSDEYKLVFVAEDTAKGERAITLYPYLNKDFLCCEVGTELVDSLQGGNLDKNPHLLKERAIFRATLIEYLSGHVGGKERFKILITTWAQFLTLYENNLSTYLSGFSFHKAKQEVASAQLAIADQMSKVVGDMSSKILSVPISLVATIAISKAENVLESSILVLGIAVTSALLAETLAAQKLQYERVRHSSKMMFSALQQRIHHYPTDLRNCIDEAVTGLSANERKLRRSLRTLRLVSWVPAVTATMLHAYLYREELQDTVVKIYQLLHDVAKYNHHELIDSLVAALSFF